MITLKFPKKIREQCQPFIMGISLQIQYIISLPDFPLFHINPKIERCLKAEKTVIKCCAHSFAEFYVSNNYSHTTLQNYGHNIFPTSTFTANKFKNMHPAYFSSGNQKKCNKMQALQNYRRNQKIRKFNLAAAP